MLRYEVVNNVLFVWLKRARYSSLDGYRTSARITVIGKNNGTPSKRLIAGWRSPLGNTHRLSVSTSPGGSVPLEIYIALMNKTDGGTSETVELSLSGAPSGVTLSSSSALVAGQTLFNTGLQVSGSIAIGTYNFNVRLTYGSQVWDLPLQLTVA